LFRTIWTDAFIDQFPNYFEGASAMLGNKPETVQLAYRQYRREQHLKSAVEFTHNLFSNGRRKRA
jgi:hypothetical protein